MKREYGDYIEDILDAMNKVNKFTENMNFDEFVKDDKTVFAVVRCLEIIGEAVKNIPEEIEKKYPEIPWKNIAGMRNKLSHEYFGVKVEIVWDTVKKEIPEIKPKFQKIMEDFKEG